MFGIGGFTSAFLLTEVTESALVVLPATFVGGLLTALVIGALSVHTNEVYFAMITLAFAQILYLVAFNDVPAILLGVESVTGGDNGIFGVPTVALPGLETGSTIVFYYLTLALLTVSFVVLIRIANSPFGRVLLSISENEERAEFVGYDVTRYKIIAFGISGGFAGLAGGLFVSFQSIAHANLFFWTVSGEAILMVLVGGMGTLWGPMIGGGLIIFLEEILSSTEGWRLILGVVFVVIVLFAPTGLSGIIYSLQDDQPIPEKVKQALYSYIESVRR
jgi:branched-chain amino acid transport system permease protein